MSGIHPLENTRGRQHGAAALVVAVILLVAVTLAVLFTASTAVLETRMSANEVRTKQARAAAQAGLDFGISELRSLGAFDATLAGTRQHPDSTIRSRVIYLAPDAVPTGCPDSYENGSLATSFTGNAASSGARSILVFACGWSDDNASRRAISIGVSLASALPNPPQNPLTARGRVDVNGAMTVYNYFSNLTVWAGESFDITSNTGKTAVRAHGQPEFDFSQPAPTPGTGQSGCNPPYRCTSDQTTVGSDVLDNDLRLSNLLGDAFFLNAFGSRDHTSIADWKASFPDIVNNPASLSGLQGEIIWIDGDKTIGSNDQIGTRENPVILIVDGDLQFNGGPDIFGVVYVTGNLRGSGGPDVYGAMIVEGDTAQATGNVKIIFDPIVNQNAQGLGIGGTIPGTWRDWF